MHCHKSRENGVPIQGPPSASAPAKKPETRIHKQFVPLNYQVGIRQQQVRFHYQFHGVREGLKQNIFTSHCFRMHVQ